MRHVPLAEFTTHVAEIVTAVEAGEDVTITRHGREVVRLIGVEQDRLSRQRIAIDNLLAFRRRLHDQGVRVSRDEIIEWKNEGRR